MKPGGASPRNWAWKRNRCVRRWERLGKPTRDCWGICGPWRRTTEMKIPINLASNPFRRDRAMMVASLVVCALLVATLGLLANLALQDSRQIADVRREVKNLHQQIDGLNAEEAKLDAVVKKPENARSEEHTSELQSLRH